MILYIEDRRGSDRKVPKICAPMYGAALEVDCARPCVAPNPAIVSQILVAGKWVALAMV